MRCSSHAAISVSTPANGCRARLISGAENFRDRDELTCADDRVVFSDFRQTHKCDREIWINLLSSAPLQSESKHLEANVAI